MIMLIKNNTTSSKRAEMFNAPAVRGSVETSGTVDNPTPYRPPLPAYEGISRAPAEDTKVITIGKGVVFSGKVIEADHVKLEGKADGEVTAKTVELSSSGSLDGNVKCDTFIVAGAFSGEATVSGSLSVKSTGKIEGKISYGSLAVEAGGAVLGTLEQAKTKDLPDTPSERLVSKSPNPE